MSKRAREVAAEWSIIRNDADLSITATGYYEPEQDGGLIDESFSAWVSDIRAEDENGNAVELIADEVDDLRQLLLEVGNDHN